MRNILLVVGVAGLLGFFSACSGKDHAATIAGGTTNGGKSSFGGRSTGATSSGGKSGSANAAGDNAGGAGGAEGGAGSQLANNGPVVKITAPAESATPDDGVLSDQVAHVVCTVLESSAPTASAVDPASVTLSMTDSAGKVDEKNAT
ncbi:MAG TPA: hypothetical protein VNG33_01185, partial [Polyangiaceae bacterium]|nr:hypothetical protein [Polyangiaceae bacterium]